MRLVVVGAKSGIGRKNAKEIKTGTEHLDHLLQHYARKTQTLQELKNQVDGVVGAMLEDTNEIEKTVKALDDLYQRDGFWVLAIDFRSYAGGDEAMYDMTLVFTRRTYTRKGIVNGESKLTVPIRVMMSFSSFDEEHKTKFSDIVSVGKLDVTEFMSHASPEFWKMIGLSVIFPQFVFRGRKYKFAELSK